MVRSYWHTKKAFSFIEILIAIFIVGVGAIPVLTMYLSGSRTVEKGGVLFQVAVSAQNIMDTVRSDTFLWEGLPVNIVIPSEKDRGLFMPKELVEKYKAVAKLTIDEAKGHIVNDSSEQERNLYRIDLTIDWIENGEKRKYSLMNYRANTNSQNLKAATKFE